MWGILLFLYPFYDFLIINYAGNDSLQLREKNGKFIAPLKLVQLLRKFI